MTNGTPTRGRLLLVGGGGGLVGRAVLGEFGEEWAIRSVHRHPALGESGGAVEWVPADVARVEDWRPWLHDVDLVVNVAWYRAGSDRRFRPLAEGLRRLIEQSATVGVARFVHVSLPRATDSIEATLPYMVRKREVDRTLASSGLPYSIVRPTMLFGPGDKLLTVMLRTMTRWHRFPLFGDGEYHVSPIAVQDLASILRREAGLTGTRTVDAGGPRRYRYRDLTDSMFDLLHLPRRYLRWSVKGGRRVARLLESFGSSLLYEYEVEWLVSDRLGLPPYEGLSTPLRPVEEFLRTEATRLRSGSRNG